MNAETLIPAAIQALRTMIELIWAATDKFNEEDLASLKIGILEEIQEINDEMAELKNEVERILKGGA